MGKLKLVREYIEKYIELGGEDALNIVDDARGDRQALLVDAVKNYGRSELWIHPLVDRDDFYDLAREVVQDAVYVCRALMGTESRTSIASISEIFINAYRLGALLALTDESVDDQ